MTGITGYLANGQEVPPGTLGSMADALVHSPKHLKETYQKDGIGIARVHLGVFGPTPQPVFSSDGSVGAFGEGLVYGEGISRFNWVEKVLARFRDGGVRSLAELNGSFSLAMFEPESGRVRLVTDRFSTRPLYYWSDGGSFAFATESKAILRFPYYRKRLNLTAVSKYFRYGRLCVFGDDTWFEGIRGLQPGSVLTYEGGEISIERYWDLSYQPDPQTTEEEFGKRLAESFKEAVRIRTADDGLRHSVALSGGLDSRVVLAAAGASKGVTAYTFGQENTHELAIASRVARTLGVKHSICVFNPDDTAAEAERVVSLSDGLETVGISFLLHCDKMIDGSLDVSLDGFALDLTLGGSFLRKAVMEATSPQQLVALLDIKFAVFGDGELGKVFDPAFASRLGDFARGSFRDAVMSSPGRTMADRADYFALRTRVRNFTVMGHVLSRTYFEDTFPTLDNGFLDVITKVPATSRFKYSVYRKFLRELSPEVARIPYERTGFSPNLPYSFWFLGAAVDKGYRMWNDFVLRATSGRTGWRRGYAYIDLSGTLRFSRKWRGLIADTLVNEGSCMYRFGILNRSYVVSLVSDFFSGRRDTREKILYLITFELVLRTFFSDGI